MCSCLAGFILAPGPGGKLRKMKDVVVGTTGDMDRRVGHRQFVKCRLIQHIPNWMRLVLCVWQFSRREILRAKSPSLSSTVKMWSAEGSRASNTLTGADGLYNGRSVSRQNQPSLRTRLKYGASAPAVVGLPLSLAILIPVQRNWVARLHRLFQCRSVAIRNGAQGQWARAWRIENSPARGRDTRTLFRG